MKLDSAASAVISEDGRCILLQKRRDFRLWALPGGGIEPDEDPVDAAVRETREETGYHVAVDRLVGVYPSAQPGNCKHVYAAHAVGGEPIRQGPETVAVRWFPVDHLPITLVPWHRPCIRDALMGSLEPADRLEPLPGWQVALFKLLIRTRDALRLLRTGGSGRGGRP